MPAVPADLWSSPTETATVDRSGSSARRPTDDIAHSASPAPLHSAASLRRQARREDRISSTVAAVSLVVLGLRFDVSAGISLGLVVVLLLAPVWYSSVRYYRGARVLLLAVGATLFAGCVLSWGAVANEIDTRNAVTIFLHILTAFGSVGVVLWARRVLPLPRVAMFYGTGTLIAGFLAVPGSVNPWKYELATPLTILSLAAASHLLSSSSSRSATVGALCALGCISIINDYRSNFGMCMVAVLIVLWQSRKRNENSRLGQGWTMALLATLIIGFYYGATALLVGGYLGVTLQQRSELQIEQSGNLITGGRPESAATFALIGHHPWGYGLGAVPQPSDIRTAKAGMYAIGVPLNNGYVDHYMFGGQFKLHSITADLWSACGPMGIALALLVAVLLVTSLTSSVAEREPSALAAFLVLLAIWDLAFGPIFSDLPEVAIALGLVLIPHQVRQGAE